LRQLCFINLDDRPDYDQIPVRARVGNPCQQAQVHTLINHTEEPQTRARNLSLIFRLRLNTSGFDEMRGVYA
jgi:hypothetical protein